MKKMIFDKWKNRLFSIVFIMLLMLLMWQRSSITANADGLVYYVSATGNDSTGDGSLTKPFKTIYKAYTTITSTGTIALLSDINIDSTNQQTIITDGKSITITSAKSNGDILNNAANNYDGVYKIIRGSAVQSLLVVQDGNLTLRQIFLDGGSKEFAYSNDNYIYGSSTNVVNQGGYLVNLYSANKNSTLTLDTNSVLQNNWNIGSLGKSWGGAVCISFDANDGKGSPIMTMKSNAIIRGNKAPRHGGAITSYTGKIYIQDDARIVNNGIYYKRSYSGDYFGGGALLVYKTSELHMSGNATIENNYVDLNGSTGTAVAVQVQVSAKIYLSGNARIFDNFTKNISGVADNKQANVYDKTDSGNSLIIEGALGEDALIGITAKTLGNGAKVAEGSGSYTVTANDADKIFDDTLAYRVIKHSTDNKLVLSSEITQIIVANSSISSTVLSLSLNEGIYIKINDTSLFLNGVQLDKSKYFVASDKENKKITITFTDKLTIEDTVGLQINKNGYKFNNGAIYEIEASHTHSWTYSASDASLKATCSNTDGLCPISSEDKSVSISLTANSPTYNTGGSIGWKTGQTISFLIEGKDEWKAAISESSLPEIYYTGTGSTTYSKSTIKPTLAGTYTATISAGETNAALNFYIRQVYQISFNANGGNGAMSDIEVYPGNYILPLCSIKPPMNKEFEGWATSSTGQKISTTTTYVSSNITLYAKWKAHTHGITSFNLSDGVTIESCGCGYYIIRFE